jgi:hypothetical protein
MNVTKKNWNIQEKIWYRIIRGECKIEYLPYHSNCLQNQISAQKGKQMNDLEIKKEI